MLAEAREVKAVEGASRVGTAANPRGQGLPRAWKMAARGTRGLISEFPREAEKPEYSVLVLYFEMLLKKRKAHEPNEMHLWAAVLRLLLRRLPPHPPASAWCSGNVRRWGCHAERRMPS